MINTAARCAEVQPATAAWSLGLDPIRIPADQVAHLYRRERPTQWRGESPFGAVGGHLWTLGDIDLAALAREQAAAYWGVMLEEQVNLDMPPVDAEALQSGLESATADTEKKTRADEVLFEIGQVRKIPAGMQAKLLETSSPHSNYQAFSMSLLKAISSSLCVPYAALSGDTSQANYSSMRGDEMNVRPRLRRLQHLLITRGMIPVTRAWLRWGLLSGELRLPGARDPEAILGAVRWQLPGWEWVDPKNEAAQEEAQLKSGKKSWIDVAVDGGRDPEDLLDDFARIQEWNESRGLDLPLPSLTGSPGATTGSGGGVPEPPDVEAEEPEDEETETQPEEEAAE
jgi:lambda family phage portal protein